MTPEEFEALPAHERAEAIARHDENERDWRVSCPRCQHRMVGKLKELRGKACEACGYGS